MLHFPWTGANVWEVPASRSVDGEDDATWVLRLEGSSPRTLDLHSVLTAAEGYDCTTASCLMQDNCQRWGKCGMGNCKHKVDETAVVELAIHAGRLDKVVCCS